MRWSALLRPRASVLDVACGRGRHARFLAERGHRVLAVDRDPDALSTLRGIANIDVEQHDLESSPWPFPGRRFDAVIVTHYLHRPLLDVLVESVEHDGVLIYETFATGNERFGRPASAAFLLRVDELLDVVRGRLQVVAFEQGEIVEPRHSVVQRLCAVGAGYPWPWPIVSG